MKKFISLCWFHLKLFSKNGYFLSSMLISTFSILLLQYIAGYAAVGLNNTEIWLRSGIFGLWTSATTAAGAIGFQRYQGTLPYLLNNATSDVVSLAALIVPSASFGLLAFPVSYLASKLLGISSTPIDIKLVLWIVMLWIGAVVLDFGIAALFVLTPNALVYEELILIPVLLISGIFQLPNLGEMLVVALAWLIPISPPIQLLLNSTGKNVNILMLQFLIGTAIWLIIAYITAKAIINKARKTGSMGVI